MSMMIQRTYKLPDNVPMLTSRSTTADFNVVQRALWDMFKVQSDKPALMVITKTFPDFGEDAKEYKGKDISALKLAVLSAPTLRLYMLAAPAQLKNETVHNLLAELHTAANNKVCACLAPHLSEHLKSTLSGKVGMTTTLSSRVLAATG